MNIVTMKLHPSVDLTDARRAFDADPRYNGQALTECQLCKRRMFPQGRDPSSVDNEEWCTHAFGASLWPREKREDCGYPYDLALESAQLRRIFYPEETS